MGSLINADESVQALILPSTGSFLVANDSATIAATVAPEPLSVGYLGFVFTCRGVELRHLRWRDLDLFSRVANIRRSKTAAGNRAIPLNGDAMAALARLLERARALGSCDAEHYVFPACEHLISFGGDLAEQDAQPSTEKKKKNQLPLPLGPTTRVRPRLAERDLADGPWQVSVPRHSGSSTKPLAARRPARRSD